MNQSIKLFRKIPFAGLLLWVFVLFTIHGISQTKSTDTNSAYRSYLDRANMYYDSLPDSVLHYCDIALRIVVEQDLKDIQAQCLKLKGYFFRKQQQLDSAQLYLRKAGNLYLALGNQADAGEIFRNQAIIYEQIGKIDSSIILIDKAIEIFEEIGDSSSLASTWLSRGSFFEAKGDYEQALKDKKYALEINQRIKDTEGTASAYNNLGVLYFYMSDYKKSVENLLKSARIKEKIGDKSSLLSTYINIGSIYQVSEDFENALIYYDKTLELAEDLDEFYMQTSALNNKALVYQELNKKEQAIEAFKQAISIARTHHFQRNLYVALGNTGMIYASENKHAEAIKTYEQALKLKKESGDKREMAKTLVNIGESLLKLNKPQQAIVRFRESLELSKSIDDLYTQFEASIGLSDALKASGKYKEALRYYELYSQTKDSVYNIESRQEIAALQTQYETEKKEAQIKELQQAQEIRDLRIHKQESELTKQRLLFGSVAIVLILAIFIGILLFSRYRIKQQSLRNKIEKKKIEIEQRLLRSQINPHFIFNALNSIQSFMAVNNTMSGLSYLSKFARLMRLILENSRMPYVGLDTEIESLKLNLELEKMRFEDRFDFRIDIDETIETEFIRIPPMVAQPFVENVVLHAFPDKISGGLIELKYELKNKMLRCIIRDNGIGREASTRGKKPSGKSSLGMQLTTERLELMRRNTGQEVNIHINDLKDSQGKACGTEVILDLPIKDE